MKTLSLDELTADVKKLPALPDVMVKVLKLTGDSEASARDIGNVISTDLAFTSRVLAIANSAYYGMPRGVRTVNDAVVILGVQTLRNLALAAATCDTLRREMPGYGLAEGELWRHSVACALASQILAKQKRAGRMEEAFVAGLLHDVGKVVLQMHAGEHLKAIRAIVERGNIPFHEAEKMALGFDHAEAGAKVADRWSLPPALCSVIAGHHCVERGAEAPELTAVVHVANALCQPVCSTIEGGACIASMDPAAVARLSLTEEDLTTLRNELDQQLERAEGMFSTVAEAA